MQRKALIEAGVTEQAIYTDGRGAETLDACINSLRPGDELVVSSLGRLTNTRKALAALIDRLHVQKKVVIVEALTGRRTDDTAVLHRMILDAVDEIATDRRTLTHAEAVQYGKLGGAAVRKMNVSDEEGQKIWDDVSILTTEALERIGCTSSTAYRRFGKRGLGAGRPPKGSAVVPKYSPGETVSKVYFLLSGDRKAVKIGTSKVVNLRLASLNGASHRPVRLLAAINGTRANEIELHRRFAKYRMNGEWFRYEGELKDYIATLPKPTMAVRKNRP